MIHLLFFISTLDGGGAEKVLVDLLKQLSPEQYDITLVTLLGGVHEKKLPDYVKYRKLIKSNNPIIKRFFCRLFYKILPPRILHRLFLHGPYDIEIGYLTGFPSKIIQYSSNKNSKRICFIHGDLTTEGMIDIYGSVEKARMLYKQLEKVCFVSSKTQKRYIDIIGETGNLSVIHNIVDVDKIQHAAQEEIGNFYDHAKINIISTGRLIEIKGFFRLLEIVKKLNVEYDNYTLTILGSGQQEEALKEYIEKFQLSNVRLLPFQTNPYKFVSNADLFVCSSYSEGYSTAVSEAALLGVPVITTECAGMDEIFSDHTGGRIVKNTDEALLQAIREFMRDSNFRESLKNESAEKKITYEKVLKSNIENYQKLFNDVLQ